MGDEQVERQLMILTLLQSETNGFTLTQLESKFSSLDIKVSRKTLQRDLDHLSEAAIPIYEETINNKTYYKFEKYRVKDLAFSVQELLSLYFIREMVKLSNDDYIGQNATAIIEKIMSNIPKTYRNFIEKTYDFFRINVKKPYLSEIDNATLNTIIKAAADNKSVEMQYHSFSKNEKNNRVVDPYRIIFKNGTYYLIAYCHLRKEIREFRVSRIIDVRLAENVFERQDVDIEKLTNRSFENLIGEKKYHVKIRFIGEKARYMKEYDIFRADRVTDEEDGSVIFERVVYELEDIKKWVLGYGAGVEVLEPRELRELIKKEVEEILKNY